MLHDWRLLVNGQYERDILGGLKSRLQFLIQHMRYARVVATPVCRANTKKQVRPAFQAGYRRHRYHPELRKGQQSQRNSRIPIPAYRLRQNCGIRLPFLLGRQILPRGIDAAGGPGHMSGIKARFPLCFLFFGIYYHCT